MPGAAGTGDPHLEQAMLAQLPAVSYLGRWRRGNSAPPPSPAPVGTAAAVPPAAQAEAGEASPGAVPAQAGDSGAAAADGAEPPKPVAPALTPEQREAGRLKALEITAQRKELREQLQAGALTLAQALARDDEAARGMRTQTLLRALPGIGGATTARLMREAGIDAARRVGALTTGQAVRLLAGVATVDAELAARHGHRVTIPARCPSP
jgi:histone H3/H4